MVTPYNEDTWIVGETEDEGEGGIIVRCRAAVPEASARKGLDHLIIVGWGYEPMEGGVPSKAVDKEMDAFEQAVLPALETSGAGVLAASITGGGVREWRFYAIGPDAFIEALNTALETHPEYPLEFEAFDDPDWNALAELLPD